MRLENNHEIKAGNPKEEKLICKVWVEEDGERKNKWKVTNVDTSSPSYPVVRDNKTFIGKITNQERRRSRRRRSLKKTIYCKHNTSIEFYYFDVEWYGIDGKLIGFPINPTVHQIQDPR